MKKFIQNGVGIFDVLNENDEYQYYVNEIELRAMRRVLDEYKIKYSITRIGYDDKGNVIDEGTPVIYNA